MFKETFCHSGLHNRIMFCLMGSLRDSNHLRSTLVVYQRSGTPHREMTHECWWAMFARLIWVTFTCLFEKHLPSWMFIWLPCICMIWTVVLFTVISKHHAWTFRWHHGATSTIRQVMLLQTQVKKPLEKMYSRYRWYTWKRLSKQNDHQVFRMLWVVARVLLCGF